MCLKKQHSHLLLRVFIVLLLIYCMFCFSFCLLHIGVNLPDSVKNILWLGIRPLSKYATCGHCRECEKVTPHRKKHNNTKNRIETTRKSRSRGGDVWQALKLSNIIFWYVTGETPETLEVVVAKIYGEVTLPRH